LNPTLKTVEMLVDIIFTLEIVFNFLKITRAQPDVKSLAINYMQGTFIVDVVSTIPCMITGERFTYYWLKVFRIFHLERLNEPVKIVLSFVLFKYSKKRQNDLISFSSLIFKVIYMCHCLACIWLYLGKESPCVGQEDVCTKSWVFANDFADKPNHT
jgi:hypothetical protein